MLHLFQIEYSTRSNLHIFPILNYYSSLYYKGQRASYADLPCHCWLPFQLLRDKRGTQKDFCDWEELEP